MNSDEISQILVAILGVMIFILILLSVIFIVLKFKENKKEKKIDDVLNKKNDKTSKKSSPTTTNTVTYNKQSIMDFMEFDKIEDNMIIQKKGKRFLMIIECQGVNYDLMSKVEKIGVEEGFQQFLNTLRHPIQIYIQTRTINLQNSINTYKSKLKDIEDKYEKMKYEYTGMKNAGVYSKEDLDKYLFELTKQRNLYEYGKDLVANTEKMSLNRSVLNQKFYIITPYFPELSADDKYDYEEIKNMAFSELYTKSQSMIRTLSACSVNGKILSSKELVELLYVAYNRDESELFGIDKAIDAGYDELYSTAPDIFEKKIKVLDEMIEQRAIDLANKTVEKVKSRTQKIADEKEGNIEELVKKMAEIILNDNKEYVGEETAEKAIKEIKKSEEGGEKSNEEIKEKSTRGRKKKSVQ